MEPFSQEIYIDRERLRKLHIEGITVARTYTERIFFFEKKRGKRIPFDVRGESLRIFGLPPPPPPCVIEGGGIVGFVKKGGEGSPGMESVSPRGGKIFVVALLKDVPFLDVLGCEYP